MAEAGGERPHPVFFLETRNFHRNHKHGGIIPFSRPANQELLFPQKGDVKVKGGG